MGTPNMATNDLHERTNGYYVGFIWKKVILIPTLKRLL